MNRTSKAKRPASAESIARLAENGHDISSYFTNKGKMMPPLVSKSAAAVTGSDIAARGLEDYRRHTRRIMHQVHQKDLVYEFFFVFARFERALLSKGYVLERNKAVFADWEKFAKDRAQEFNPSLTKQLQKAVGYYEQHPPKKEVIYLGRPKFKEAPRHEKERLVRLVRMLKIVRNNLFHGEKVSVLLEGDSQRDKELLEYGLTILYACLYISTDIGKKFFRGAEPELEENEQ